MTLQEVLVPGTVIELFCDFTTPPKSKLLVLVSLNPRLLFFIINSELNDFKKENEEVREHQVQLMGDKHPTLLKHDSWVDCSKAIRLFDAQEIARQLQCKLGIYRGVINNEARVAIRSVVKESRILENRYKNGILNDLKDLSS